MTSNSPWYRIRTEYDKIHLNKKTVDAWFKELSDGHRSDSENERYVARKLYHLITGNDPDAFD